MHKTYLLLFIILTASFTQAQSWDWVRQGNGDELWPGFSIATLPDGSSYGMAAYYASVLTFGNDTITNESFQYGIFVVKYDVHGNVGWLRGAKSATSQNEIFFPPVGSGTDKFGNLYIAGTFLDSAVTFGNDTLRGQSASNFFMVKYDSTGNIIWAKTSISSIWGVDPRGMSVDANGNVYIIGDYSQSVIIGDDTFVNPNPYNNSLYLYWLKFDPQGNIKKIDTMQSAQPSQLCSINTDVNGNIYLLGISNEDSLSIGNNTFYNSSSNWNYFIVKYDSSYDLMWANCSYGSHEGMIPSTLNITPQGDVYLLGSFRDTIIFGSDTITNPDTLDLHRFIAKFDSLGEVKWVKGTVDSLEIEAVKTDAQGNLYACGFYFGQSVVFGPDTLKGRNYRLNCSFAGEYDPNGNPLWALGTTGIVGSQYYTSNSQADGLSLDDDGNVYIIGFSGYNYLIFGNDSLFFDNPQGETVYIAKITQCALPVKPVNTSLCTTLCGSGSITLTANSSGAGVLSWYSADSGGVYFGAGSRFTTPDLTTSRIYYVQDSACGGILRTPVAVTINPIAQTLIFQSICNGQAYYGHTASGTYIDTLTSTFGCDSIRNLQLTVNPLYSDTVSYAICQGDTFNGHNLTGFYTDTLTSLTTCDSLVTLHLMVNQLPVTPTISQQADTLSSSPAYNYQWYLNGAMLIGDSSQVLILSQNGNYSVVVGDSLGCSNSSTVLHVTNVGIITINNDLEVSIFPNPASVLLNVRVNRVNASLVLDIKLSGAIGNSVFQQSLVNAACNFAIAIPVYQLAPGIYLLQIKSNGQVLTKMVAVER